jgi:hypothetical protein
MGISASSYSDFASWFVQQVESLSRGRRRIKGAAGVPKSVARRIQRQRARGDSRRKIADGLNQARVPTAQGGARWYAATIRGILLRSV